MRMAQGLAHVAEQVSVEADQLDLISEPVSHIFMQRMVFIFYLGWEEIFVDAVFRPGLTFRTPVEVELLKLVPEKLN